MSRVPYSGEIRNLMYALVCDGLVPNFAHVASIITMFTRNPKKPQWKAIKLIWQYLKGIVIIYKLIYCYTVNSML